MKLQEIKTGLAAQFYYGSPEKEKGISFEALHADLQKPFLDLAESVMVNLDKMNLCIRPVSTKNAEEVEILLRGRIETEVASFFAGIKVWKKGLIPQAELVARIHSAFKNL